MQSLSTWFMDSSGSSLLNLWLDAALKATVLLLAAVACTAVMRRSSAAVRHRTWCLTFAGLIALPFLSYALPALRIPVLPPAPPAVVAAEAAVEPMPEAIPNDRTTGNLPQTPPAIEELMPPIAGRPQQALPAEMIMADTGNGATTAAPNVPPTAVPVAPSTMNLETEATAPASGSVSLWLIVWLAGCALVALPMLASLLHGAWIGLRAAPMTDPVWTGMLRDVQSRLQLTRRVALVELDRPLIPMTWGVLRPVVLVPKLARDWSERLRRFVLLHELAHVKRWDVPIQLLGRIACAMYWFHPLAWYALRRLRIEREHACDDCVVTAGERPSDYAEQLLQIARTCRPAGFATVAVAMARSSHLEGRIRAMFDRARSHVPLSVHAARMLFLAAAILVTTVAVIRPGTRNIAEANGPARDDSTTAAASPADDSQPPGSNTNAAVAAEGTPQEHVFTYHGRVVDEDGAPVNGATVYVFRSGWKELWEPEHEELARATLGADGRFEITFTDPLTTALQQNPRQQSPTGQYTYLFATAAGYAPAVVNTETSFPDTDVLLKLEQGSVPIQGRVLDLEGRPVAGANVHFWMMFDPAPGAVDDWLAKVARLKEEGRLPRKEDLIGMNAIQSEGDFPLRNSMRRGLPGLPSDATTDAEGRFQFDNPGTDRLAILEVEGPGIVPNRINVVTRSMPDVDALALNYPGIRDDRYYGASFDYVAEPSRPVLGTIRDSQTGRPLAGVTVNSRYLAGSIFPAQGMLSATTDDAGRFRIDGLPKGQGNRLSITPRADQPYFVQDLDVPDTDGVDPVELTVDMSRGVLITGRLTDVRTGGAVAAQLCYTPLLDNPHAEAYENYDPRVTSLLPRHDENYFTDKDGNFRLVAIPGRGILAARCQDAGFVPGYGFQELATLHSGEGNRLKAYDYCSADILHTLKLVEIEAGAAEVQIDLQVDSGASVTVQTVDASGTPISGVRVNGESTSLAFHGVSRTPEVTIRGLHADWARRVIFYHPERQLGTIVMVRGEGRDLDGAKVTLHPCATITGRLVHADGAPVATAQLEARFHDPDEPRLLTQKSLQRLDEIAVSAEGSFRYEGIPAGGRCRLLLQSPEFQSRWLIEDFTVQPGQKIELGEVNVDGELPRAIAVAAAPAAPQRAPDVTLRGTVVDPSGKPVAGAVVRAQTPLYAMLEPVVGQQAKALVSEVRSDAGGEFEISFATQPFGDLGSLDRQWAEIWKRTVIAASAPGYGPAWTAYADLTQPDQPLRLQLVEDLPVQGRIVDLEGQPIAGVTVQIGGPRAAANEDLSPWIEGIKAGEVPWTVHRHAPKSVDTELVGIPDTVTSDADGRFEIRGVGRERVFSLVFEGETVAHKSVKVATRDMAPIDAVISTPPFESKEQVFGARFTFAATPARTVTGVVRDAATGEPLAGAAVESNSLADFPRLINNRVLKTVTDAQGRFRLTGMPKGDGNRLLVLPNDEQPYFMQDVEVPNPAGLDPVEVAIDLHRGIWITGRVTDAASGAPVHARLHYLPYRNNPSAIALPEFDDNGNVDGDQLRYQTRSDGTFRLVGLPGPAVIGADSVLRDYPRGQGYESIPGPKYETTDYIDTFRNPVFPSPKWPTAMKYIDPPADAESVAVDFPLDAGASVTVRMLDPEGRALTGVTVNGLLSRSSSETIAGDTCALINFGVNEERTVLFSHKERGLGWISRIKASPEPAEPIVVRLQPVVNVKGRLLTAAGDPLPGVSIEAWPLPSGDFAKQLPNTATGADGRFTYTLLPGCSYHVRAEGSGLEFASVADDLAVEPGQAIDLGDIRLGPDGKVMPNPAAERAQSSAAQNSSDQADQETGPSNPTNRGAPGKSASQPQQGEVTLRGRIIDSTGEPVADAGIYWMTSRVPQPMSLEDVEFRQRAATGADGRFETTFSWSDIPGTAPEIPIIVYKPGYAVAGRMLKRSAAPEDVALTLVADSPIHGRIIDTEGQPVVGARVALNGVYSSSRGLDPFLAAWKQEWGMAPQRLEQHLHTPSRTLLGATTDAEGRFELHAVGKEQVALIEVTAPTISALQCWVVNRDGFDAGPYNDAATARIPARLRIPGQIPTLTGPDFTQVAESSLSIEGTVFTGESRTPVAGANVFALTGYDAGANAKSDAQGKFRLTGLPRGRELLVTIRPAGEDSDLLKRTIPVSAPPGETTVRVDVELRRGVVLTGRVVDLTTGAGVRSGIRIVPLPGNSYVDQPGYDGYQRDHTMSSTDADGRFRIVAVPGPIVLMAQTDAGPVTIEGEPACPYRQATFDEADRAYVPVTEEGGGRYFRTATNAIEMLSTENAVRYFDLPPDSEPVETELRVDRGKTVEVQIVDDQGVPVRDVIGAGLTDHWPITYQLHEPRCTVFALGADRPRTVLFLQRDRQLAGSLTLTGDEDSPATVTLAAAGRIKSRATDESGAPLSGLRVILNYAGGTTSELQRLLQLDQPVVLTDDDGRFEVPSVVPGQKFAIDFQRDDGAYFRAQLSDEQKQLDRGGEHDYGDVVVRKLQ